MELSYMRYLGISYSKRNVNEVRVVTMAITEGHFKSRCFWGIQGISFSKRSINEGGNCDWPKLDFNFNLGVYFWSTTIFIIFWDLTFYQLFLWPQVKWCAIITYKHGIYELPNDLRLRILGNTRKVSKPHRMKAHCPAPCQTEHFVNTTKKLFKNRN